MLLQPGNIKLANANLFTETVFSNQVLLGKTEILNGLLIQTEERNSLAGPPLAYLVHLSESSIHYQVEQEKFLLPEHG